MRDGEEGTPLRRVGRGQARPAGAQPAVRSLSLSLALALSLSPLWVPDLRCSSPPFSLSFAFSLYLSLSRLSLSHILSHSLYPLTLYSLLSL